MGVLPTKASASMEMTALHFLIPKKKTQKTQTKKTAQK